MSEQNNVSRTSSQVLELQHLIAAPLVATIEADAMSAQKYMDYLVKIAFEGYDAATGSLGKLRMLTFSYNEQDANGRTYKREVSVPLLTLLPLPLLHVEEADFDFDIKIIDALTEKAEETFSYEKGTTEKSDKPMGMKMRATLAPRSGKHEGELQQSLAANMKVKVKMRQSDMPAGLSNLLHIAANNMNVSEPADQSTELSTTETGESEDE